MNRDSPFSQAQVREQLSWFANQDPITHTEIFRHKQSLFRQCRKENKEDLALLDFACFCQAICDGGWKAERDCQRGKAISEDAAKAIATRRRRRAENDQAHRVRVQSWLHKNWGKVLEYRRASLGWRRVAQMIKTEHGISISHTTLVRYDRKLYK